MQRNCCQGSILFAAISLKINLRDLKLVQFQVQNVVLQKIYLGCYAKNPLLGNILLAAISLYLN